MLPLTFQCWLIDFAVQTVDDLETVVGRRRQIQAPSILVVLHAGDFISAREHKPYRGYSWHRKVHGLILLDSAAARNGRRYCGCGGIGYWFGER
jgi:hypothetical protein